MSKITATIATEKGDINLNLFEDKAPLTVLNFINLAKKNFYNNLQFHRVIDQFMIQGGCPIGNGTGNPGYQFIDECTPELTHSGPGILSMANSGPNTNGSQFFITHVETPWLDGKHTVFGAVVSETDQEVVNSISQNDAIFEIIINGDTTELEDAHQDQLVEWNTVLDQS